MEDGGYPNVKNPYSTKPFAIEHSYQWMGMLPARLKFLVFVNCNIFKKSLCSLIYKVT